MANSFTFFARRIVSSLATVYATECWLAMRTTPFPGIAGVKFS